MSCHLNRRTFNILTSYAWVAIGPVFCQCRNPAHSLCCGWAVSHLRWPAGKKRKSQLLSEALGQCRGLFCLERGTRYPGMRERILLLRRSCGHEVFTNKDIKDPNTKCRNRVAVEEFACRPPRVATFVATLGFEPQSLWDKNSRERMVSTDQQLCLRGPDSRGHGRPRSNRRLDNDRSIQGRLMYWPSHRWQSRCKTT